MGIRPRPDIDTRDKKKMGKRCTSGYRPQTHLAQDEIARCAARSTSTQNPRRGCAPTNADARHDCNRAEKPTTRPDRKKGRKAATRSLAASCEIGRGRAQGAGVRCQPKASIGAKLGGLGIAGVVGNIAVSRELADCRTRKSLLLGWESWSAARRAYGDVCGASWRPRPFAVGCCAE